MDRLDVILMVVSIMGAVFLGPLTILGFFDVATIYVDDGSLLIEYRRDRIVTVEVLGGSMDVNMTWGRDVGGSLVTLTGFITSCVGLLIFGLRIADEIEQERVMR